jgi:hypothetical protein
MQSKQSNSTENSTTATMQDTECRCKKLVPLTDEQWKQKLGDRQLFTILEAIRFVETVYGIKGEA